MGGMEWAMRSVFSGLLLLEHPVNGRVKQLAVALYIGAARVRLSLDAEKPAVSVGLTADKIHILHKREVALDKLAINRAIKV